MTSALSKNISALLRARGLTMRELSRRSGVAPTTLSSAIKGTSMPRANAVVAIANALNVTADDLWNENLTTSEGTLRAGTAPVGAVPILSFSEVAQVCAKEAGREPVAPKDWAPKAPFKDLADTPLVAVYCEGVAMEPTFESGDLLYLQGVPFADETAKPSIYDGCYVLALAKGQPHPVVRIFVQGDSEGDWLYAENVKVPHVRAEKILGVVVAKASRVK